MAFGAAISGSISSQSLVSRDPKAALIGFVRQLEASIVPSMVNNRSRRRWAVKPLHAVEPTKRNDPVAPPAAASTMVEAVVEEKGKKREKEEDEMNYDQAAASTMVEAVVEEKGKKREKEEDEMNYDQLARELENASPLEIMDKALAKFGIDIAIAFSGAEDVALIEYARLTGRPFRVFSLDTGRLNPETYRFFDAVEKHYDIHIEYMFPDAVEVQAFVRSKGLFSFYEDGHQECCRVRKVRPLRRALKGLRAWITGQRKDQSPGTRAGIPVVQVDSSFEGMDGGIGSLIKWNPVANMEGKDIWNFLRTMDVPVNSLHSQGYVSIGCEPCTRPVLPGQHEREGRWWWEDAKAKECGLHKGNIAQEEAQKLGTNGNGSASVKSVNVTVDVFENQAIVNLSRPGIENLLRLENRREPWLVVLYAPWCRFCQGMEASYLELAEKLSSTGIKVGKFRADGDQKPFAQQELQLGSFPTVLFFPKHASRPIKYPSERRDVDSLLAFINALR